MFEICKILKDNLQCNSIKSFSSITNNIELILKNGKGVLKNYYGKKDNIIRLCGVDEFNCNTNISSDLIYSSYKLDTPNSFNFKYAYIDLKLENISILDNIRILTVVSEEKAFNIFKNTPNNYIFIIPNSKNIINADNANISFNENFKILIYWYNKNNLNDIEILKEIDTIENDIINSIYNNNNYNFINSNFLFNTDYTIIKSMQFNYISTINRINNKCYLLDLKNPIKC